MKKGFTFVEIMIVVAIIAILAIIAIPNFLRVMIANNESATQVTLKKISEAFENYASANSGMYPTEENQLTDVTPPYLNQGYDGNTLAGYNYSLSLSSSGYNVTATCVQKGTKCSITSYQITTGAVLSFTP
ncbi:MAG: prepilin-type N-terminal cleavage/methylation domain-containing protein [Candidatus Omnitrophica bacterium]|nr:prepilin-type N-terminal cleavage/methylation domain-containing protein [Candidatus Omnitrophota bacterium]